MNDFDEVYVRYLKEVYAFLLKLSRNPDVAEELTQDTFAAAFENLDKFRGTCKMSVWLCQIAKHKYYRYCKKNNLVEDEFEPEKHIQPGSLEEKIIDRSEWIRIHEILHNLPEPYKEVFTLRIMGELEYKDISRLFKKSESWARVTYYRAKKMIIERLEGEENDEM